MAATHFFVCFGLFSFTFAATISTEKYIPDSCNPITGVGCETNPAGCQLQCGCDGKLIYDEKLDTCIINRTLFRKQVVPYPIPDDNDDGMSLEDNLAKIRGEKVDNVFRGIIVSAIFFIVCTSVCVVSVCIFCCHIRHSDRILKNEVKALAEKLNIDINKKDRTPLVKPKQRDQKEESCNVVVTDANVLCV